MTVFESRKTRSLLVQLQRGDELPNALLKALNEMEVHSGWLTGIGTVEAVELALSGRKTRRIDTACDVVSLSGSIESRGGTSSLRLAATLARETEIGVDVFAGQVVWARALSLDVHVTAFDAAPEVRVSRSEDATPPVHVEAQPEAARGETMREGLPQPIRYVRPHDDVDIYPEPGDLVTHFHFGDCAVVESDGERIRLRQEKDGRVREVALTMLRIQSPTTDEASGKRRFVLARKN